MGIESHYSKLGVRSCLTLRSSEAELVFSSACKISHSKMGRSLFPSSCEKGNIIEVSEPKRLQVHQTVASNFGLRIPLAGRLKSAGCCGSPAYFFRVRIPSVYFYGYSLYP